MRRNEKLLAPLIALTLASGCGGPSASSPAREATSLGDAIAAFPMSLQLSGVTHFKDLGYVVLVDPDGSTRFLETTIMQNSQLSWRENGLAFADTENDYILTDTMTTILTDEKTNYQQAIHLSEDGQVTSLYNEGRGDQGYDEQVVISSSGSSILRRVEGFYQVSGFCNGSLHGIAEPSGKFREKSKAKGIELEGDAYGYIGLMLNQLTDDETISELNVGMEQVNSSDQYATDAPCIDGKLRHLASVYDSAGQGSIVLRSWSIDSGQMTELTLKDENDEPFIETEEYGLVVEGISTQSLRGGVIDWVDVFGNVWSSDIETGSSKKLYELVGEYEVARDGRVVYFGKELLTTITNRYESGNVRLVQYDRLSGDVITDLDLPEVARVIEDWSIWSVAAPR